MIVSRRQEDMKDLCLEFSIGNCSSSTRSLNSLVWQAKPRRSSVEPWRAMISELRWIKNDNVEQQNVKRAGETRSIWFKGSSFFWLDYGDAKIVSKPSLNTSMACPQMTKKINRTLTPFSLRNVREEVKRRVEMTRSVFVEELFNESEHLLDDVSDEFAQCKKVKKIFEQWKSQQTESYTDAFIEICLPKVFSPLIRREMIDWKPFEVERNEATRSLERPTRVFRHPVEQSKIINGIKICYSTALTMDTRRTKAFNLFP